MNSYVYRYCENLSHGGYIDYYAAHGQMCPVCRRWMIDSEPFDLLSDDFESDIVPATAIILLLYKELEFSRKDLVYGLLAKAAYEIAAERVIATGDLRKQRETSKIAAKIYRKFRKVIYGSTIL